jgi:hypothetical protein
VIDVVAAGKNVSVPARDSVTVLAVLSVLMKIISTPREVATAGMVITNIVAAEATGL